MKLFKIGISYILIFSLSLVLSSFTSGAYYKPFAVTTFYYKSGYDFQRILYGTHDFFDLKENSPDVESMSLSTFSNINSWTIAGVSFTPTTDLTKYIGSISFNLDSFNPPNGGTDGDLTLQEALNALADDYLSRGSFMNILTIGVTSITFQPASAAH